MRYFLIMTCFSLSVMACSESAETKTKPQEELKARKEDSLAIHEMMKAQEAAWNFGQIEEFMKPYWHSDSLRFIGKRGMQKGWQATLENYKKSYPDQAAMGRLVFENLEFDRLDERHAFVVGRWTLYRTLDTLGGHYSLLWKKINNKWVIVADHSS